LPQQLAPRAQPSRQFDGNGNLAEQNKPAAHQGDFQVPIYNVCRQQEMILNTERFGDSPLWKARKKA
jgi:hypothetical protein